VFLVVLNDSGYTFAIAKTKLFIKSVIIKFNQFRFGGRISVKNLKLWLIRNLADMSVITT